MCHMLVSQQRLTPGDPMNCSPPRSSVHGILQARTLERVAIPFSRGIFPTQKSNLGLLQCGWILYRLSHQGSPRQIRGLHIFCPYFAGYLLIFYCLFCCVADFQFDVVPLTYFSFCCLCFCVTSEKSLLRPMTRFASTLFTVSGLNFKYLIHSELIFVGGVRQGSSFIFCLWLSSFLSTVC